MHTTDGTDIQGFDCPIAHDAGKAKVVLSVEIDVTCICKIGPFVTLLSADKVLNSDFEYW